jgi:hypothetical protein
MTKSHDIVNKVGLFAIGLSIGSFCTIARIESTLPIALRVSLVAISVAALFVGLFSLSPRPSKDYQSNSSKDHATDNKMGIMIPSYPDKGTDYHQTYTQPFHILLSPLRHIINYSKEVCQSIKRRTYKFRRKLTAHIFLGYYLLPSGKHLRAQSDTC